MGLLLSPGRDRNPLIAPGNDPLGKTYYDRINLEQPEYSSLGSKKFVVDMLTLMRSESNQILEDAYNEYSNEQWDAFSKIIQKLKNNLLLLGISSLKKDLDLMERHAADNGKRKQVERAFEQTMKAWFQAEKEVLLAIDRYQ